MNVRVAATAGGIMEENYGSIITALACRSVVVFLNASAVKWVERLESLRDNCVLIGCDC